VGIELVKMGLQGRGFRAIVCIEEANVIGVPGPVAATAIMVLVVVLRNAVLV
jgi:hypothetical protein